MVPSDASLCAACESRSNAQQTLAQLMKGIVEVPAMLDRPIMDVTSDSRNVRPGAAFFAQRPSHGMHAGGELFIAHAIAAGAVAVVRRGSTKALHMIDNKAAAGVVEIQVEDPIKTLACVADRWFGIDTNRLQLVGITGTNGKSSVAHFVAQALTHGRIFERCGVLGTLGSGVLSEAKDCVLQQQALTTLDLISLRRRLAQLSEAGAQPLVMEVSSHALVQRRTEGLGFCVAVFTNLSHEHLDYHHTMTRYFAAKRRLFDAHRVQTAVINTDDRYGQQLARELSPALPVYSFSTDIGEDSAPNNKCPRNQRGEHLHGQVCYSGDHGLRLRVRVGAKDHALHSPLLGRFNARNLMATLAVLYALKVTPLVALEALTKVFGIDGRMQLLGGGTAPLVIVDFAHTPQALVLALHSLREMCSGTLWCVFGCGGERDRGKRALMGQVASTYADRIVITDDNPRGEDGDAIVSAIASGLLRSDTVIIERDRGIAIRLAVTQAGRDDVVLIAGKGHERYQQYKHHKRYFCDSETVTSVLAYTDD